MLAAASAVVFLGLVGAAIVTSPGWDSVRTTFFSLSQAKDSLPDIARGFWVTIKLFMTIEPIVLVAGLLVALVRISRSPVMFPLRALSVAFVDLFRGVPTLLLVFLVGFGLPALQLQGIPNSAFWLGVIALSLSYTAYVAEVIRAGIASVHPAQRAAARSLGLSDNQTMRSVVLPQAFRNVAPPLLNDFISLQKDTALVASLGLVPAEALREAYIDTTLTFNYTPLVVAACFYIALTIPLARITDYLGYKAIERQFSFAGGQR
jgi:polar amino acid transport system permease protein